MFYKESKDGQVLQEGINEAGAMSDWIAAATAYSVHGVQMIPFYICYSMFGFQRTMDLCWAAADQRSRGFLIGGTAGRTTLNGEGLQHEDGHSLVLSSLIPNCLSYDPTFSFEIAVIMQEGMRRMYQEQEDIFYYVTVMNENYEHPEMPAGAEADILKGMYLLRRGQSSDTNPAAPRVQLLGSGTIFREVIAAAELLKNDWGIDADLWGCPSFTELARNGNDVQRWNMLNPIAKPKLSHVESCLGDTRGPIVAATDYVRMYRRADPSIPQPSLRDAGHRRLWSLGHAREVAPFLRGRSPLGHRGRPEGSRRRRHDRARQGRRGDRPLRHRREQTQPDDGLREPSDESIDRSNSPRHW
jgi:pyruvate dehydrogenase E1 component